MEVHHSDSEEQGSEEQVGPVNTPEGLRRTRRHTPKMHPCTCWRHNGTDTFQVTAKMRELTEALVDTAGKDQDPTIAMGPVTTGEL